MNDRTYKTGDRVRFVEDYATYGVKVGECGTFIRYWKETAEHKTPLLYIRLDRGAEVKGVYAHRVIKVTDESGRRDILAGQCWVFDVKNNPPLSAAIQQRIFQLGGQWCDGSGELISCTGSDYLYVGALNGGHDGDVFVRDETDDNSDVADFTPATILALYPPRPQHVITIDGKEIELSYESYVKFKEQFAS